jgi:YebC/PmpR family DNA-binding regulatory protein
MSGHSKWSTIKRQKSANDAARGQVFSKLSRGITIAAKTGGPSPESNYRLKMAIEAARAENMPKDTIDRAINKATTGEAMEEVMYEGFVPGGVGVLVYAATDNRNRTAQEIKSAFEHVGGSLAGPGSVSFNFSQKEFLLIQKKGDIDDQILSLIDLGAEEVEDSEEGLEVYVSPDNFTSISRKLEDAGYAMLKSELVQKPKSEVFVDDKKIAGKLFEFYEKVELLEDVQRVFDNAKIADTVNV